MRPRRTATPSPVPRRAAPSPPDRRAPAGVETSADRRDGVVGGIGGRGDDGRAPRALVARLRRAGERGERAPASLRARVAALLAAGRGGP